jgi:sortase A
LKLAVSRSHKLLIGLGAVIVLASIPAAVLFTHSPGRLAATSGHAQTTALATPSKSASAPASASAAPSATVAASVQATPSTAERNAAAAVAGAAPATPATALLSIPRIGIKNAPIYDRSTNSKGVMLIAPGYAVTHYSFSAGYGTGNTVLYGHDDIQGNIFGHLYDLAAGDLIQLTVGGQTLTYRVSGHQIVTPTTVSVLAPTGDIRLTIITCWPFNVDTKRWIVTALKA